MRSIIATLKDRAERIGEPFPQYQARYREPVRTAPSCGELINGTQ